MTLRKPPRDYYKTKDIQLIGLFLYLIIYLYLYEPNLLPI